MILISSQLAKQILTKLTFLIINSSGYNLYGRIDLVNEKIFLIRHAKSSWGEHGLKDIERPLNERGRRVFPHDGKVFKEMDPPSLVMISPAQRAVETAHFFKVMVERDPNKNRTNSL